MKKVIMVVITDELHNQIQSRAFLDRKQAVSWLVDYAKRRLAEEGITSVNEPEDDFAWLDQYFFHHAPVVGYFAINEIPVESNPEVNSMRLVNAYEEAKKIRQEWIKSHYRKHTYPAVFRKLEELGDNPCPHKMNKIFIARKTIRTRVEFNFICHECGEDKEEVMEVCGSVNVCAVCLLKAFTTIEPA